MIASMTADCSIICWIYNSDELFCKRHWPFVSVVCNHLSSLLVHRSRKKETEQNDATFMTVPLRTSAHCQSWVCWLFQKRNKYKRIVAFLSFALFKFTFLSNTTRTEIDHALKVSGFLNLQNAFYRFQCSLKGCHKNCIFPQFITWWTNLAINASSLFLWYNLQLAYNGTSIQYEPLGTGPNLDMLKFG